MKFLTAVVCLLIAIPLCAQDSNDQQGLRDKILALENAWNQAEEHKDAKALDSILASTLVYIDYDGSLMDKAGFMASVRRPSLHPSQIVNDLMTTQIYGDTVIVSGVYRESGALDGKPYSRRGRFTDTWVSMSGTWQCVASQSTLIER